MKYERDRLAIKVLALLGAWIALGLSSDGMADDLGKSNDINDVDFSRCLELPGALDKNVEAGKILLFGEIHGTWEFPAALADVVCAAKEKGIPVQVGLEYDHSSDSALNKFVKSQGEQADREELIEDVGWNASFQDGTYSAAMFELLEVIRKWNMGGTEIRVFGFDIDAESVHVTERKMAGKVKEAADQGGVVLVLTGNYHSRTKDTGDPGSGGPDSERRMGQFLRADNRDVVSIEMKRQGGTVWVCRGPMPDDCGVAGSKIPGEWRNELKAMPQSHHHDYQWVLGTTTAARPAVEVIGIK